MPDLLRPLRQGVLDAGCGSKPCFAFFATTREHVERVFAANAPRRSVTVAKW